MSSQQEQQQLQQLYQSTRFGVHVRDTFAKMKFLPARQHHASFAGSRRTDRSVSVFTQISATLSLSLSRFPQKGTKLCAPRFVKQADPRLSVARLRKTSEPDCKLTEPPHRVPFTFRKVHLRPMAGGRQPLGELGEKMEITSTHKTFRQKKGLRDEAKTIRNAISTVDRWR